MSERPFSVVVAVRDRASGRFLSAAAQWSDDLADALVLDAREAALWVRRFACEPQAVEVVPVPGDRRRAVA